MVKIICVVSARIRHDEFLAYAGVTQANADGAIFLVCDIVYAYLSGAHTTLALIFPLGLRALNLLAAIAYNPAFRRQTPLLIFHLSLLTIVLLTAGLMTFRQITQRQQSHGDQRRPLLS